MIGVVVRKTSDRSIEGELWDGELSVLPLVGQRLTIRDVGTFSVVGVEHDVWHEGTSDAHVVYLYVKKVPGSK
jgi:hypothetical protein